MENKNLPSPNINLSAPKREIRNFIAIPRFNCIDITKRKEYLTIHKYIGKEAFDIKDDKGDERFFNKIEEDREWDLTPKINTDNLRPGRTVFIYSEPFKISAILGDMVHFYGGASISFKGLLNENFN